MDWIRSIETIAPPLLAAKWDNTGLLIEGSRPVEKLFFTIDLTEDVLEEALDWGADAIVAYHPPIFRGLKKITRRSPTGRIALDVIRAGVHVYAPHTALDAAADGMNDWLAAAIGAHGDLTPIEPDRIDPTVGMGRTGTLIDPVDLDTLVSRCKEHLGLRALRVAAPANTGALRSFAVCPGAGGSAFEAVRHADVFLTGEMRHHDVLARVAAGSVVVLTDHTNTERGFLPEFARRVEAATGLEVRVSRRDQDPLEVR